MNRKLRNVVVLLLLTCLLAGCGSKKSDGSSTPAPTTGTEAKPTGTAPTEVLEATPADTPTPTLTPTPRPPFGVTSMSLYKNIKSESLRRKYGDQYKSEWVRGTDITSFECIASDAAEIKNNNRYFQELWRDEWQRFSNNEQCKICYRVQFQTSDGVKVDKMLMKAGDELEYRDYIENYLYDDIHQVKGQWYSHLEPKDQKDTTILSSLKFTPGVKIDKVYSPITVSAYVYYSDLDFDAEGNYIGAVSYTVQMVNTSKNAITLPEAGDDSTAVEPNEPTGEPEKVTTPAKALNINITNSNGKGKSYLVDKNYSTRVIYAAGDVITVSSESEMAGIYLIWGSKVVPYTLTAGSFTKEGGEYGMLHDYIAFPTPVKECTIRVSGDTSLCDIYAYSEGVLPETVQVWEPPYKEADILIFSTHADDEVLFFGGVATLYGGVQKKRVQVVYLCHYWNGERIREHEKLDGLWTMGLRAYPVNMNFDDHYAENLAEAKRKYNFENVVAEATDNIRRFRPLIIVTHDINGEYGHGGHILLYNAVKEAIDNANNAEFAPESVQKYGTWDVPKTYIHLLTNNPVKLDLRQPAPEFGGMTPLEVAKAAYKKHVSQQWCWFYVSDEYEYSCAEFGLLRSTVGMNQTNDMFEHLTSYEEQEELARLEEERRRKEEEERLAALEKEAQLTQAALAEKPSKNQSEAKPTDDGEKSSTKRNPFRIILKVIFGIILSVVGVFAILLVYAAIATRIRKKRRMRKREELRRRAMAERARRAKYEAEDTDEYL